MYSQEYGQAIDFEGKILLTVLLTKFCLQNLLTVLLTVHSICQILTVYQNLLTVCFTIFISVLMTVTKLLPAVLPF